MNRWISRASVLFLAANLALACGDDDDDNGNTTGSGGSAGKGGSGGKGGTSSSGGGAGEGGTSEPGSGGGGGAPEPVTCEPPTPPTVDGGEGGAGGSGGAEAAGGAGSVSEGLAIAGTYVDEFDGEHEITNAIWTNYGVYNISQFDNEERYVIARNDESNTSSPCAWSRFDWTYDDDELYYCQTAFAAKSEQAALDTEPADADDLEEGCSGFPWSKLTPQ